MADTGDQKYNVVLDMKEMQFDKLDAQALGNEIVRQLVEQQQTEITPDRPHYQTHSRSFSRSAAGQ